MTHLPGVQLQVLHTAQIPTPYGYVFRSEGNRVARLRAGINKKGKMLQSPCLAYVVRHADAGAILIDTGLHPDASADLREDFGFAMAFLFSDLKPAQTPYDDQLRAVGVSPEDVERVVMTHLHVDHTSGMRLLPNATFLCTRQEWAAAHRRFGAANGYVGHHLPPASRMELVDFERDGDSDGVFAKTIDLVGDGTIRLIFTPGHTRGHQSVLLRLDDGRTVLLVGDAAYTVRSINEQLLPMLTANDQASLKSLGELNAFARENPEAILVPSHDPYAWRALAAPDSAA
jgi:glyoxylase-like metal-dependent hydrolase (beta-lactamase superfamily II)